MTTTDTGTNKSTGGGAESTNGEGSRISAVADRMRERTDMARDRAREAYRSTRGRTSEVYGTAKEKTQAATRRTADGIEANPVAAVFGGLAVGALLAALLPSTRREKAMLGTVGQRISDTTREAARAAREAGVGKLNELGINGEAARDKIRELASGAGQAVRSSAGAAAQTLKSSDRH
jgi:ElaB/YqjD/DUF883 family membrane-anchored ribosome-binding protein